MNYLRYMLYTLVLVRPTAAVVGQNVYANTRACVRHRYPDDANKLSSLHGFSDLDPGPYLAPLPRHPSYYYPGYYEVSPLSIPTSLLS